MDKTHRAVHLLFWDCFPTRTLPWLQVSIHSERHTAAVLEQRTPLPRRADFWGQDAQKWNAGFLILGPDLKSDIDRIFYRAAKQNALYVNALKVVFSLLFHQNQMLRHLILLRLSM